MSENAIEMYCRQPLTDQELAQMKAHRDTEFARAEAWRALRHQRWGVNARGELDTTGAMVKLVRSFHSLVDADAFDERHRFDAEKFVRWAMDNCHSHGETIAVRFILSVWNSGTDWAKAAKEWGYKPRECKWLKRFDLFEALTTFDLEHQAALAAWVEAPFWP